jgi:hypothetical protein
VIVGQKRLYLPRMAHNDENSSEMGGGKSGQSVATETMLRRQ